MNPYVTSTTLNYQHEKSAKKVDEKSRDNVQQTFKNNQKSLFVRLKFPFENPLNFKQFFPGTSCIICFFLPLNVNLYSLYRITC